MSVPWEKDAISRFINVNSFAAENSPGPSSTRVFPCNNMVRRRVRRTRYPDGLQILTKIPGIAPSGKLLNRFIGELSDSTEPGRVGAGFEYMGLEEVCLKRRFPQAPID